MNVNMPDFLMDLMSILSQVHKSLRFLTMVQLRLMSSSGVDVREAYKLKTMGWLVERSTC